LDEGETLARESGSCSTWSILEINLNYIFVGLVTDMYTERNSIANSLSKDALILNENQLILDEIFDGEIIVMEI
jgi:hypothetical protein